jgi:hypothetical protein
MSHVVVSQEGACKRSCVDKLYCRATLYPRMFLCLRCRQQVLVCRRYDFGQVYCGPECALEVRRSRQREARSRYQASERGRLMHAERSRRYRARGRPLHRVTDQGQNLAPKPAQQSESARATALQAEPAPSNTRTSLAVCHHCGPTGLRLRPPRYHSATVQTPDYSLHGQTGTLASAKNYGSTPALTGGEP